ncbi:hypothetical protein BH18THE2_BH18THE2_11920 [soil metagenome]
MEKSKRKNISYEHAFKYLLLNIRPPTRHRRICNVIFIYKMRRLTNNGYREIDYEFDTDFECF